MTLHGSEEVAVQAFRLGVYDYLRKPFKIEDVLGCVRRALRESRLKRERDELLIVMMHYPPVVSGRSTAFSEKMACSGVDVCIYGHIHCAPGEWPGNLNTEIDGVRYRLVSADYLDFKPLRIL